MIYAKPKSRYQYKNPRFATNDEDIELFKKLISSSLGIVIVITLTILFFTFLGPKIFSLFGYLSLDRLKKTKEEKLITQPPVFSDTKKSTKDNKISINGFSEPGSTVRLFVNGPEVQKTTSDSGGKFTFTDISLSQGQNIMFAKAEAQNKSESEKSESLYVTFDNKKPEIEIISPKHGEVIESVDSRINVKGIVSEKAAVSVNSHLAIVDESGNFQTLIAVKEGDNIINVLAVDEAGNEASKSISIKFKKP